MRRLTRFDSVATVTSPSSTNMAWSLRRKAYWGNRGGSRKHADPTRDVIVTQGTHELLQRRGEGATKMVKYTNKKGRVFNIAIPISKLTHPQKKLVSPIDGKWKHLDTSYVDTGDFDEDTPTRVDEVLARAAQRQSVRGDELDDVSRALGGDLRKEMSDLCTEYITMDRNGMVNLALHHEKNFGPDYEDDDRKLKRRRHWFTLKHRFHEVRERVWPTTAASKSTELEDAIGMFDALRLIASANSFGITKRLPYEDRPDSDYEPIDTSREVRVLCAAIAQVGPSLFFTNDADGIQRLTTVMGMCRETKNSIATCFLAKGTKGSRASRKNKKSRSSSAAKDQPVTSTAADGIVTLTALFRMKQSGLGSSSVSQRVALNVMGALSHTNLVLSTLGDAQQRKECWEAVDWILGICTLRSIEESFREFDASDMVMLLEFLCCIRKQNAVTLTSIDGAEKQLRHHTLAVLQRCGSLLYQRNGNTVTVMSEDEYIPYVDMQQHTERQRQDVRVHEKIGRQHAQGLRVASLHARHAAQMMRCMEELRSFDASVMHSHPTMVEDTLSHLSMILSTDKAGVVTIYDCITVLNAVGDLMAGRGADDVWRVNKILSTVDQRVGALLHEVKDLATATKVISAFGRCGCEPSCRSRIEAVGLRCLSSSDASTVGMKDLTELLEGCEAMSTGRRGDEHPGVNSVLSENGVSPALLERVAQIAVANVGAPTTPTTRTKVGCARNEEVTWRIRLLSGLQRSGFQGVSSIVRSWTHLGLFKCQSCDDDRQLLQYAMLLGSALEANQPRGGRTSSRQYWLRLARSAWESAAIQARQKHAVMSPSTLLHFLTVAHSIAVPTKVVSSKMSHLVLSCPQGHEEWSTMPLQRVAALRTLCAAPGGASWLAADLKGLAPFAAFLEVLAKNRLSRLLDKHNAEVKGTVDTKSRTQWSLHSLDHKHKLPVGVKNSDDDVPPWDSIREVCVSLLQRDRVGGEQCVVDLDCVCAKWLGAYLHRLSSVMFEWQESSKKSATTSFEQNSLQRSHMLQPLQQDMHDITMLLEGRGLLLEAEAQFDLEEAAGRPDVKQTVASLFAA